MTLLRITEQLRDGEFNPPRLEELYPKDQWTELADKRQAVLDRMRGTVKGMK